MKSFLVALQFLTILPVSLASPPDPRTVGHSLLWYPVTGGLIGLGLMGVAWLTHTLENGVQASLVLTAWVLMTGALHLDGLADSADAWVGGFGNRERTLAIMKDPYCGPMGVTVLVLVLLSKFATLEVLLSQQRLWPLLLAPLLARTTLIALFLTTPYIRPGGLGDILANQQPRVATAFMTVSVLLTVPLLPHGSAMMLTAGATFLWLRWQMMRRLGGTTGDSAGATVELSEAAALMAALI